MAPAQKLTTARRPLFKAVNQLIMKNGSNKYHNESIVYRSSLIPTMFAQKCMPLIFDWYFSFVQKMMFCHMLYFLLSNVIFLMISYMILSKFVVTVGIAFYGNVYCRP